MGNNATTVVGRREAPTTKIDSGAHPAIWVPDANLQDR